ncbi:MAG TPA: T9SS type A sorting domain-containing protein [Ignavibacteria bacterium]|nr:T9SS type A sorting domain-containing protein [Ignavibacteria bacterium]
MKGKFTLLYFLSLILVMGLLVGFISQITGDPNADTAPVTENTPGTGFEADTGRPLTFPYPTAFNFNYSAIPGPNSGTVGAIMNGSHWIMNKWNTPNMWYRRNNNGPSGGPGTLADSTTYPGAVRDLTNGPGGFVYGGSATNQLRRINPATGATMATFTTAGAIYRAIAYDPNRKGFWNCDFGGNITCYDTAGVLKGTITTIATAKYGLAWDSTSTADSAWLWVWNQGPGGTAATTAELYKYHVASGTLKATYIFNLTGPGVGIAGGAECMVVNNKFILALNWQNQAITGYVLKDMTPSNVQSVITRGSLNKAIPDNTPAGIADSFMVTGGGTVLGVEVVIDSIVHTWCGDLKVTLTHAGKTDTLVSRMGTGTFGLSQNDLINVALKDTATRGIWTATAADSTPQGGFRGSWRPGYRSAQDSLAKFIGTSAAGSWVVRVSDNASGDLGTWHRYTVRITTTSALTNNEVIASTISDYTLSQNYPNPFNPSTKINFSIPKAGFTTLKVYDILGKEVATLVNGMQTAGTHTIDFNASNLASGAYFYRIQVGDFVATKRMLLIK